MLLKKTNSVFPWSIFFLQILFQRRTQRENFLNASSSYRFSVCKLFHLVFCYNSRRKHVELFASTLFLYSFNYKSWSISSCRKMINSMKFHNYLPLIKKLLMSLHHPSGLFLVFQPLTNFLEHQQIKQKLCCSIIQVRPLTSLIDPRTCFQLILRTPSRHRIIFHFVISPVLCGISRTFSGLRLFDLLNFPNNKIRKWSIKSYDEERRRKPSRNDCFMIFWPIDLPSRRFWRFLWFLVQQ